MCSVWRMQVILHSHSNHGALRGRHGTAERNTVSHDSEPSCVQNMLSRARTVRICSLSLGLALTLCDILMGQLSPQQNAILYKLYCNPPVCVSLQWPPVWWLKMIPVLICALITLSIADSDLDTLYPELEHSRTIYVTGEWMFTLNCWMSLYNIARCRQRALR